MQRSSIPDRQATPAQRKARLKSLPAVSRALESRGFATLQRRYGRSLVTNLLRERLADLRQGILTGEIGPTELKTYGSPKGLAREVEAAAKKLLAPRPTRVINATGIVVHTNLGRSVMPPDAAEHLASLLQSYMDLEYDLDTGGRGSRMSPLEPLMQRLFPGHAFHVVNNNAAAVMLALRALSHKREVLISRGELVEIGGSFRVPDILSASGAKLKEVGTTNRTRVSDYKAALTSRTGLILKVHTSNFKIVGFTEEPELGKLSAMARKADVPLVVDWGSGDLVDLGPLGILDEQPVEKILAAGADVVTFSGDKLLGGPQAGFIVGRADLLKKIKRDPMARACRLDRMLVAALQRTLASYVRGKPFEEIPTLRMLALSRAAIARRATRVRREVGRRAGCESRLGLADGISKTGGGASPTGERPTRLLTITWPTGDAAPLERTLRAGKTPVIGRVQEGRLLLDLRTVHPEQDAELTDLLVEAIQVADGKPG